MCCDDPTAPLTSGRTWPDAIPRVPEIGERVGRYQLLERLGAGGMGTVFRAQDPQLERWVALKVLHRGDEAPWALLPEARGLAMLADPRIVSIYAVERTAAGHWAFAMELVEGGTLQQWLDAGPAAADVLDAFVEAGEGLVVLHAAGLIHRDFKPANVLMGPAGRVCLTDLGLVGSADPDTSRQLSGTFSPTDRRRTVVGTPAYMAPEQHAGEAVDPRADQYAFCVAAWQALVGVRPFVGRDLPTLVAAKRSRAPRLPRTPGGSRRLRRILRRGLAERPDDRWPSMRALVDALRAERARRRRRTGRWAVAAAIGLAAVATAVLGPHSVSPSSPPRIARAGR